MHCSHVFSAQRLFEKFLVSLNSFEYFYFIPYNYLRLIYILGGAAVKESKVKKKKKGPQHLGNRRTPLSIFSALYTFR